LQPLLLVYLRRNLRMQKKTIDLIKKFENDHDVTIDPHEQVNWWDVTVWMTKVVKSPRIWGRKFITTPGAMGEVLVIRSPQSNDIYTQESWGKIDSFDEFVEKVLARITSSPLEEDEECACGLNVPEAGRPR
jgi:hypothetical protein